MVESGILPVRWPYAISFWRQSSAVTTILDALLWQANSNGRKYFSAVMMLDASFFGSGRVPDEGLSEASD